MLERNWQTMIQSWREWAGDRWRGRRGWETDYLTELSLYLKLTFWTIITGGGIVPQAGKLNDSVCRRDTGVSFYCRKMNQTKTNRWYCVNFKRKSFSPCRWPPSQSSRRPPSSAGSSLYSGLAGPVWQSRDQTGRCSSTQHTEVTVKLQTEPYFKNSPKKHLTN